MKKSLIPIFLSIILLSGSAGIAEAASLTPAQISAIIGLLRSFGADEGVIMNVSATLSGTAVSVPPSVPPVSGSFTITYCPVLKNTLYRGSSDSWTGGEVSMLQRFLRQLYPDLPVTGYFGVLTEAAVERFQSQYGISTVGIVGPETSKKIASLCDPVGYPIDPLPPVSAGYLQIEPSSASLAVGGSASMQAIFQPPMPKCDNPEFACPQVMPARYPVVVAWISSNPSIASIDMIGSCAAIGCPTPTTVLIKGVSSGTADINASYKSPSGVFLTATAKVSVGSVSPGPSITLISPSEGSRFNIGGSYTAKWVSTGIPSTAKMDIEFLKGGVPVGKWPLVNDGIENFVIPSKAVPGSDYALRIWYYNPVSGASSVVYASKPFSIVAAESKLLYTKLPIPTNILSNSKQVLYRFSGVAPKDGGDITITNFRFITSKSGVSVNNFALYAYADSGFSMQAYTSNPIGEYIASIGNDAQYLDLKIDNGGLPVVVPSGTVRYFELRGVVSGVTSAAYLNVALEGLGTQTLSGGSGLTPFITVTSPNGGETCQIGSICKISWKYGSYFSKPGSLSVELYKGGNFIVSGGTAADDIYKVTSYDFNLPTYLSPGSDYSIKVLESDNPSSYDKSDAPFSIVSFPTDKMTVILDASTPYHDTILQGKTQVPLLALKFSAPPSTGINIFQATIADIMNSTPVFSLDLRNFSLWDGATKIGDTIGSVTPPSPGVTPGVTFSPLKWYIPPGTSRVLTVRADISPNATIGAVHALGLYGFGYSEFVPNNWAEVGPITGGKFTIASQTVSSLTVLSPNGGEVWLMGESQTVKWSGSNGTRVNITLLNTDKTKEVYGLAMTVINDGSEVIKVPYDLPAGQYYLRVSCVENCSPEASFDDSNAPFSIVAAGTTVYESVKCVFNGSTSEQNCYTATDTSSSYYKLGCSGIGACVVDLKGAKGDKITWKSSCGGYAYTVMDGTNEYAEFNCSSVSPSVTVTSPNGGEILPEGGAYTVKWGTSNLPSDAKMHITLFRSDGANALIVSDLPATQTEYVWKVSSAGKWGFGYDYKPSWFAKIFGIQSAEAAGYSYRIGVSATWGSWGTAYYGNVFDDSNAPFTIGAYYPGFFLKIDKQSYALSETVFVTLSRADGHTDPYAVDLYAMKPDGSGKVLIFSNLQIGQNVTAKVQLSLWPLFTQGGTGQYLLAICPAGCKYGADGNNNSIVFDLISSSSLTITSPNGGEALVKGKDHIISWVQKGFASDGWIQLQLRSAANPSAMVKLIASSVPLGAYAGSFNWTVPTDIPDGKYLIWASAGSGSDALGTHVLGSDFSDAPFTISGTPGTAGMSSGGDSSLAALIFSLERQIEELRQILNSILSP